MKKIHLLSRLATCALVCLLLSISTRAGQTPVPSENTANTWYGYQALFNQNGPDAVAANNSAFGWHALYSCMDGIRNVGIGPNAGGALISGQSNVAIGSGTFQSTAAANFNTAVGKGALSRPVGDDNTALGYFAGSNLRGGGTNNIYVGNVGPDPTGVESNTIRIGTQIPTSATIGNPPVETYPVPAQTDTYVAGIFGSSTITPGMPVYVDSNGKLGTLPSSARFKEEVKPMSDVSEEIFSLKPVTFRYKREVMKTDAPQFGLVAEEVANIDPDLVVRGEKGEIESVRYEAVNAMLLNEFLKEHRKVRELRESDAEQKKEIAELKRQLDAQAAAIQKVSAQLESSRATPELVADQR